MILKKKLLLTLIAILVVPFSVVFGTSYWVLFNQLEEDAHEDQSAALEQVHAVSQKELQQVRTIGEQLAGHLNLHRFLVATELSERSVLRSQIEEVFEAYKGVNLVVDEVQLLDRDGRLRLGVAEDGDFTEMQFGRALLKSAIESTQIRVHELARTPKIIILAPVINDELQSLGFVLITVKLETLRKMMAVGLNPYTEFFLSNSSGVLVSSQQLSEDFLLLPMSLVGKVNAAQGGAVFLSTDFAGTSARLGVQTLWPDIWLVSVVDDSMTQRHSRDFLLFWAPLLAAFISFIGALLYFQFKRTMITPLHDLIEATHEIARGNFMPHLVVKSKDEMGVLARSFIDMGEQLKASSEKITQLAYFDPLTKLPNRNTIKKTLGDLIVQADRNNTLVAVLFIDLDDFKKVNDRLGHAAGDELLVVISERLLHNLRRGDMVADGSDDSTKGLLSRRGGDEFNAILTNVQHTREVGLIAERIISDINKPTRLSEGQVVVGASIGVALYPSDGDNAETLLHNADMAMYEAKAKGKNNFQIYTQETNAQVHKRLDMEEAITKALKDNQFVMHYQPKVGLVTMQVVGFEALIRWDNEERGLVGPNEFIPIAEESQLIYDIGNWVLAEVLHQIKQWEDSLPDDLRVAINISAKQLRQLNFAEHLIEMANHFEVSLNRLEIEITETSVLSDEALVKQHLFALRAQGVKVSLDDFGTGYSSLTFLSRLPIDVVKIDSSFIFDLMESKEHQAIVKSVLELCQELSLVTVAEGVEDPSQLAFLMSNSCTEGQGYLFAKPMPAGKVLEFIDDPSYLAL